MQNFKDFEKLSIKLNDTCNATGITRVLEEAFSAVNIYIYDYTSETLRDFSEIKKKLKNYTKYLKN